VCNPPDARTGSFDEPHAKHLHIAQSERPANASTPRCELSFTAPTHRPPSFWNESVDIPCCTPHHLLPALELSVSCLVSRVSAWSLATLGTRQALTHYSFCFSLAHCTSCLTDQRWLVCSARLRTDQFPPSAKAVILHRMTLAAPSLSAQIAACRSTMVFARRRRPA
jgi:hypothetical protein